MTQKNFEISGIFIFLKKRRRLVWLAVVFIVLIFALAPAIARTDKWKKFLEERKQKQKSWQETTYCRHSGECAVYECYKCANKFWIKRYAMTIGKCSASEEPALSCVCIDNICKRAYGLR